MCDDVQNFTYKDRTIRVFYRQGKSFAVTDLLENMECTLPEAGTAALWDYFDRFVFLRVPISNESHITVTTLPVGAALSLAEQDEYLSSWLREEVIPQLSRENSTTTTTTAA